MVCAYKADMTRIRSSLMTLCAVLCIALAGVVSAGKMAPERTDSPQIAAYLATGGSLAELCGGQVPDEAFHCPFCHMVAEAQITAPESRVWVLAQDRAPQRSADLTAGDQQYRLHHVPRGPPALI